MYCTECGNHLPDTAKFCPECGTQVAAPPSPMERAAKIAAFDFSADIERLTRAFTGRAWVFETIDCCWPRGRRASF